MVLPDEVSRRDRKSIVRVFHRRQQHQAAGQRDQTRIPAHAITLRGNLFRPLNTVLSDRVYHLSGNAPKLFRIASASRLGAQTGQPMFRGPARVTRIAPHI